MTWLMIGLSAAIGYAIGFTLCLLLMIQFIKAKEEDIDYDIEESVNKEMEQLRAIRDDKG